MNANTASKAGDDVRALWLLAVLIVVGAYYLIDSTYQRRIDVSRDATASYYARTVANRRIVSEAAHLARLQRQVDADLAALEPLDGKTTVSSLLTMLQQTGTSYGVDIVGVDPQKTPAAPLGDGFVQRALVGQDFSVRATGRFRGLLAFLQTVSLRGALLEISATQVEIAGRNGGADRSGPKLQATIQAKLYALRPDAEAGLGNN